MPKISSREIRLASRPRGLPVPGNFDRVRTEPALPLNGQVLVRNLFISVDPYMRGRMNDPAAYMTPFRLGEPLEGAAVGEIVESRAEGLRKGDIVSSAFGWREYFTADKGQVKVIDARVRPVSAYLGVLGLTGLTAWAGLELGGVKRGETLFVSAAAGAVGHVAGQLAKIRGCRVIGSTGSSKKVRILLDELGFDAAFNYEDGDIRQKLAASAPDGFDVYFDNVGGGHLEAALQTLHPYGRVIACGAISGYNTTASAPKKSELVESKHIEVRQLMSREWLPRTPDFLREMEGYLREGKLKAKETVVEGIESAPQAFIDLFSGGNVGKMVVKITPEAG